MAVHYLRVTISYLLTDTTYTQIHNVATIQMQLDNSISSIAIAMG